MVTVVISFTVLMCALFVILAQDYDTSTRNWAFGMVGTILGYWMKSLR